MMIHLIAADNPLSHVIQHPMKTIEVELFGKHFPLTILSDQIVMLIVGTLLLVGLFPSLVRRRRDDSETGRLVPSGFANAIEAICEYFREQVARPALGEHTDRFIKYIWSAFFFVLTLNLLGLIPIGTVTPLFGMHIGGTATANIWLTGTLAVLTFLMMMINGVRLGGKAFFAHMNPGPWWLAPLLVPLEAIVGPLAKTFALAVRLFANMVAGHILLAVLISLVLMAGQAMGLVGGLAIGVLVVAASVGIYMLELLVAFLQAFIFTYLTTLFIGMAVNVHGHDDHHEEAAAH